MSLSEHKKYLVVPVPCLVVSCSITVENLSTGPFLEATATLATEREWGENSVVPAKIQTLSRHEFCGNGFGNKLCY